MSEVKSTKVELTCHECSRPFLTFRSEAKRGCKFCSVKCAEDAARKKGEAIKITLTCDTCSKEFKRSPCHAKANARAFCSQKCWQSQSLEKKFWKLVNISEADSCWEWQGRRHARGYGTIKDGGKLRLAHRVSWEIHFGPIPEGMCVCHKCDNPPCINPSHFFLGTNQENTADRVAKGRSGRTQGEANHQAKINNSIVLDIFIFRGDGFGSKEIAEALCIRRAMVNDVLSRRRWKHVPIPEHLLSKASSPCSPRPDCQPKLQPCQESDLSQEGS